MKPFGALDKNKDIGIFVLRVGLGAMFLVHGGMKLRGGPAAWAGVGGAMKHVGVTFAPTIWGFLASISEFGGGLCLVLGLLVRPASAFMLPTMVVALMLHLAKGDAFASWSHPVETGLGLLALFLMGGGRYALDARMRR